MENGGISPIAKPSISNGFRSTTRSVELQLDAIELAHGASR
jgi:hypothetical protein